MDKIFTDTPITANGSLDSGSIQAIPGAVQHCMAYEVGSGGVVRIRIYEAMISGTHHLIGTFDELSGDNIVSVGVKGGTRYKFLVDDRIGIATTVTLWFNQVDPGKRKNTNRW